MENINQPNVAPPSPPPAGKWQALIQKLKFHHRATISLSVVALVLIAGGIYVTFSGGRSLSKIVTSPSVKSHNVTAATVDASTKAAQASWDASYRFIFVKTDSSLDQAVADASSHGVTVVSTLNGIHAYVATQPTADNAKNLPETLTSNPTEGSPAVIPDGSDVKTASTAATVSPPVNRSTPTISGSFTSGGTVTTNNGTWTSSYNLSYSQTWYICASVFSCSVRASGGSSPSFTIPAGNNGKSVKVIVTACVFGTGACAQANSPLYSIGSSTNPTPPPPPPPSVPSNTSAPVINGSVAVGNTITTTTGSWTGTPTSYKYNWYLCTSTSSCTLKTSGSASYTIPSGSSGQLVKSGVSGCNSAGCGTEATSATSVIPTPSSSPPPPPAPPTPPPPPPQQTCNGSGSQEISASLVRINARTDKTVSGDGCNSVGGVVGVIDTGINTDPDLNLIGGKSFVAADGSCNSTTTSYADGVGHGTNVASVIGSKDDQSEFVGVSPGIGLMSLRVFDSTGSSTFQAVVCAVNYAITTRTDSDPNNNIAVINMSIAGILKDTNTGAITDPPTATCATTNNTLHLAMCRAEQAGIVFAAAAGNSNQDFNITYPATFPEVLTATAMNDYNGSPGGGAPQSCTANDGADDSYAIYSNYPDSGEIAHTVAAPGTCVHSLTPSNPTNSWWSGTSEASPMVAGMLANCIYWQVCSGTAAQIQQKIYNDVYNYAQAHQNYGYNGDPWHTVNGINYGPLINLGLY